MSAKGIAKSNGAECLRADCSAGVDTRDSPLLESSQSLIVWSQLAEASQRPSGLKATSETFSLCPVSVTQ